MGESHQETCHLGPEHTGTPTAILGDPDKSAQPRCPTEYEPPVIEQYQQIGTHGTHDGSEVMHREGHRPLITNQRTGTHHQQTCTGSEGEELTASGGVDKYGREGEGDNSHNQHPRP